jgi:OmcA/MtrC family decaheme c-type cytochrome
VKDGVATFAYDIKSVTVNSSKQPVITFQIKMNGTPVTSFAVPTLVTHAVTGQQVVSPAYEPIPGFAGGPSLYVAFAVPQDGIAAPADFNATSNVSLTNLLVAAGSPKAGTLTGPDANGYWTATLTGDLVGQPVDAGCVAPVAPAVATCVSTAVSVSPITIPANATMLTGAIIGSFTQKNLADYPYKAANVSVNPTTPASGGLAVPGVLKKLVADGYSARRAITDISKCATCHDQLGTSPSFHGGVRNDPQACNFCHTGNRASSGWSADSSTFIHGIHGAEKRTVPFTWHATATDNYSMIGYPGVLKDCNQCHLSNTVNFGANGATLQSSLVWSTTAYGTISASTSISPYVVAGTNYGSRFSYTVATGTTTPAASTTLVNSPIASACFACHDTTAARGHMASNGGAIYEPRSTALTKIEGCLVCHGMGRDYDVAVVHRK